MKGIAFAPLHGSINKPGDAAGVFQPYARKFVEINQLVRPDGKPAVFLFNNQVLPPRLRLHEVLPELEALRGANLDVVAFMCHGLKKATQFGLIPENVATVGAALDACLGSNGIVILDACDTARDADDDRLDDITGEGPGGDGGMAELLRDACNCDVYAHASEGHAALNPFVRRFVGQDYGKGGVWIVPPHTPEFYRWSKELHRGHQKGLDANSSTLWARYFWLVQSEILSECP